MGIFKVNGNWLFSDEHSVLTERGWVKPNQLQNGDKLIGMSGDASITNIIECGERPDAPIMGYNGFKH